MFFEGGFDRSHFGFGEWPEGRAGDISFLDILTDEIHVPVFGNDHHESDATLDSLRVDPVLKPILFGFLDNLLVAHAILRIFVKAAVDGLDVLGAVASVDEFEIVLKFGRLSFLIEENFDFIDLGAGEGGKEVLVLFFEKILEESRDVIFEKAFA